MGYILIESSAMNVCVQFCFQSCWTKYMLSYNAQFLQDFISRYEIFQIKVGSHLCLALYFIVDL